jgi:hypothetical protein
MSARISGCSPSRVVTSASVPQQIADAALDSDQLDGREIAVLVVVDEPIGIARRPRLAACGRAEQLERAGGDRPDRPACSATGEPLWSLRNSLRPFLPAMVSIADYFKACTIPYGGGDLKLHYDPSRKKASGSLWRREHARGLEPLSEWPVACPDDWRALVNCAQSTAELDAVHTVAQRRGLGRTAPTVGRANLRARPHAAPRNRTCRAAAMASKKGLSGLPRWTF